MRPSPADSLLYRPLVAAALGAVGGAAFGAAFGAFASVFHGGPTFATGVAESWWWFAVAGSLLALGSAVAARRDRGRGAPPESL